MNIKELADRAALKELVDNVSILANRKGFNAQVQLFRKNAISDGGQTILKLKGRAAMAEAFTNFNQNFDTVYHFNGQQVVTITGNKATGTCYSMAILISTENGKKVRTTIGAIYQDNYVFDDANGSSLNGLELSTGRKKTKSVYEIRIDMTAS